MNSSPFCRTAVAALGLLILPVGLAGCARSKVTNLPDGAHRIVCERGMKNCVTRAEKLCDDKGYTVLAGASQTHLLGGSSSSYRQLSEQAELEIICGERPPNETSAPLFSLPARKDEASSQGSVAGAAVASSATACVPGATQKCVGAGACDGGQVCLPDGSGYGACDCGSPSGAQPQGPQTSPAPPAPPLTVPAPGGGVPPQPAKPSVPHSAPEPTPAVGSAAP